MYPCFMDLDKAYDRINRKAIWQVLRMCDVGSKLLNRVYVYGSENITGREEERSKIKGLQMNRKWIKYQIHG